MPLAGRKSATTEVALFATGAAAIVVAAAQLRRLQWQLRLHRAQANSKVSLEGQDILRVGFSAKRLPQDIDHIIVGSGLSGLYLAALLSKLGRRVVVLEQHYVAGGCTHTFKDKGFEFDTGVHYVGMATHITTWMDFAAGQQGAVRMQRQGDDDGSQVYNEIHIAGECAHRFRPGPHTFANDLIAKYPEERGAIRKFLLEVHIGAPMLALIGAKHYLPVSAWKCILGLPNPIRWLLKRYMGRTLSQVLDDCGVHDQKLRATLSAEFGDYGTVPDEAPFTLHAGILSHYWPEGGFYPVGGSDAFAHALIPPIFKAGGAVLVRAPVQEILIENGRAVGVRMEGNKGVVRAKHSVISAAGVETTYRRLLNEVEVAKAGGPPASLLATEKKGNSHHVYAFVGFEGDTKDLALPTFNIWSFPKTGNAAPTDLSAVWRSLFSTDKCTTPDFVTSDKAGEDVQLPAFISFPSAKDPLYNDRCPGKSTAVVLTEGRAEYFGEFSGNAKRTDEYKAVKSRYEKLLLKALFRHFPHLESKVAYVDVGTPWSNEHYLGRTSSYGLDQDEARFLDPTLSVTVPKIRGLYLTGQDMLVCGIYPQVLAAWITLSKVLGVTSPDFWLLLSDFGFATAKRQLFDRTYAPANP